MKRKHPQWLNEYIKSVHRLFKGMDLRTIEPLDCFHFHPLHSDLWQEHIYRAITRLKWGKISFRETVKAFPNPSSIRAIFEFMVFHLNNIIKDKKYLNKQAMREIFNLFIRILKAKNKRDVFCFKENIGHSQKEIDKIIKTISWEKGSPEISQELGRVYLGASSLVNGLMNDWCTDNGIEVWGPYDMTRRFGPDAILVIREFPRLKPVELWPHTKHYKYKKVDVYTIYKNVSMRVEFVGCHSVFKGDLAKNLLYYAILVNNKYLKSKKEIEQLSNYFIKIAQAQYQRVKKIDFESLKQKIVAQEFYQLKDFFKLVDMDFHPHPLFIDRVKSKKFLKGRYPLDTTGMSSKEINRRFGINNLKKLYSS
jgi:hypothetical protein